MREAKKCLNRRLRLPTFLVWQKKTPTYLCISLAVGSLARVIPGHILPPPYTNDPSGGKKDCLGFFVGFFFGGDRVFYLLDFSLSH